VSTRLGTVSNFDDAAGLGIVTTDTGETYPFHCTAITDGTRTIAVGTIVSFDVVPARNGSYEATAVDPGRSK
jgi:cold shock CspA family protein